MEKFKKIWSMCFLALVLLMPSVASAQNLTVRGKVVDSSGEAILGAYVYQSGTQNGTVSDLDGNFQLSTPPGAKITVTFVGYTSQEITVTGTDFLNIVLQEDSEALDELVVVGYAVGKKKSISGAVERVTAEEMNSGYVATPLDAVRSKVSGLVITSNGGDLGNPTVRLRGTSSLSGETGPLFIIDGMFTDISTFNSMNAADIEEIVVLKDAAETAQYGSRGASGVIVVTTSRGQRGTARVDYRGQAGAGIAYKQLPIMTPDEWRYWNKELNAGGTDHGYSTNFYEAVQNKVTTQQNHNVSLTMGNQQANMRASIGMNQREGQMIGAENMLYNMRFNGQVNTLNNKLTLELGLMASRRDSKSPTGMQRLFTSASQYNPTFPDFRNPETGLWDQDNSAQQVNNPLGSLEQVNDSESTRASATGRITWRILEGLSFSAYGSYDYNNSLSKSYVPNNIKEGQGNNGSASISNSNNSTLMGNLSLSYVRDFGKHSLNLLALSEAMTQNSFSFNARATGFDTNYFGYNNLGAGANVSYGSVGSSASYNAIVSYMARINYMYDDRYVVTVNLRTDGSSKLGANHKWGFFPSASAAWIASNESFIKDNIPTISNLKLRVGYGVTGNQNGISAYNSIPVMGPNGITIVDNAAAVAFSYSRNANPDLKWETKYSLNAGFDLGLWKGRAHASFDYYQSTTKDLLYSYSVPTPPFLTGSLLANIGQMSNRGIEFAIGGDIVAKKNWGITANLQASYQESNVDSLTGYYGDQLLTPSLPIARSSVNDMGGLTQNTGVIYISEGMPFGYFNLPVFQEFTPDANYPDRLKYTIVDQDDNGRIDTTNASPDRVYCGNAIPKWNLGANLQFRYSNFDLTAQFTGAFGHKIYNATSMLYYNMSNFPTYNVYADAPNKRIYDIRLSDYWLEKGDYVNIDYITLGWNAPIRKWKTSLINRLRVAVSCNNVATLTGYSGMTPLLNNSTYSGGLDDRSVYPISRIFMLSLQLGF